MSNNNGDELDELYLKYFPLNPLLNLASIFASLWYPMISIQTSSKAFSLPLSSLIFLMYRAQLFIPAPLKTSGFSSWDISIVFYFSSLPPWSLHLFLTLIRLSFFLTTFQSLSFQHIFDKLPLFLFSCFLIRHRLFCFH